MSEHLNVFHFSKMLSGIYGICRALEFTIFLLERSFVGGGGEKCPTWAYTAVSHVWYVVSQVLGQWEMSWSPMIHKQTCPLSVISPFIVRSCMCHQLPLYRHLEWSVLNEQGCCHYLAFFVARGQIQLMMPPGFCLACGVLLYCSAN